MQAGCRDPLEALYQQDLAKGQATTLSQNLDLLPGPKSRHCLLFGMHKRCVPSLRIAKAVQRGVQGVHVCFSHCQAMLQSCQASQSVSQGAYRRWGPARPFD